MKRKKKETGEKRKHKLIHTDKQTDRQTDTQTDGWMDRQTQNNIVNRTQQNKMEIKSAEEIK